MKISANPAQVSTTPRALGKTEKAAQDFEAMLLASLLESVEKSFSGFGEDGAVGSGEYSYMGVQALALGMAARGGIGIARMILEQLGRTKVPGAG